MKVDVQNLTRDQAAQVFAYDGPRSVAAQRAWLEDKAANEQPKPKRINMPYRRDGKKLVVFEGFTADIGEFIKQVFDRKELAKLLADMS